MPAEEPQLRISIGSRYEHIDLVQIVIDDALERLGLDPDSRHWVGIAVREAVANAIQHGNRRDPAKAVDIELAVDDGDVVIRVEDRGQGFDPGQLRDPRTPENLLRPDGRGLFYMQSFMDEIDYSFRSGGGTVVTLRKRIAGAGETDPEDGGKKER